MSKAYHNGLALVISLLFCQSAFSQEYVQSLIFGGTGHVEIIYSTLDDEGNTICTGKLGGTTDFDPGSGVLNKTAVGSNLDIFLAKYDVQGNLLWVHVFGASGMDYGESCAVDHAGNVILVARTSATIDFDPSAGNTSLSGGIIMAKYSSSGSLIWAFKTNTGAWKNEIAITSGNDILLTGICYNNQDLDPSANTALISLPLNASGVFVARYTSEGAYVFHRTIQGSQGNTPVSVIADHEDNIVWAGTFLGTVDLDPGAGVLSRTANNMDIFMIKLNGSGDLLWGHSFGGASGDSPYALACDSENNVYMTGRVFSQTDFDPSAANHSYGGACPNEGNGFLVKYNAAGQYQWTRHNNYNTAGDLGSDVTVDADDNVYIFGYFKVPGDLNGILNGNTASGFYTMMYRILGYDLYLTKYTPNGDYLCHRVIANFVPENIVDNINLTLQCELNIHVDEDYRIVLTGGFQNDIDFDPFQDTGNYSATLMDGFISFYTQLDEECFIPGNNGCTDPNACNFDPQAFMNDGSCLLDCSGCTDPLALNYTPDATSDNGSCDYDADQDGVSITQGDCDDNNDNVHPGLAEICNGVDDDCDGIIDGNCPNVINDFRSAAIELSVADYGGCSGISGNLSGASASVESLTSSITGEDVWYKFIAPEAGVRIRVWSLSVNVLIELQDENGEVVDTENLRITPGREILNFGGLTAGETYYIAVRNYNSQQGNGAFTICLSRLNDSSIYAPLSALSACSYLSTSSVSAQSYVFHFVSMSSGQTYTRTQTSTACPISGVSGLPFGENFQVRVDAVFHLTNGLNNYEIVTVQGVPGNPISTVHPELFVLSTQTCPSTNLLNKNIRTNVALCNVSEYSWSVQPEDPETPAFVVSTGTSRLLMLSNFNGFAAGQSYSIRIRVSYSNGYTTPWGPVSCVSIGNAGYITQEELASESERFGASDSSGIGEGDNDEQQTFSGEEIRMEEALRMEIYPNPSYGLFTRIYAYGLEQGWVQMQVFDLSGSQVVNRQHYSPGDQVTIELGAESLPAGMYLIRILQGGRYQEMKWLSTRE